MSKTIIKGVANTERIVVRETSFYAKMSSNSYCDAIRAVDVAAGIEVRITDTPIITILNPNAFKLIKVTNGIVTNLKNVKRRTSLSISPFKLIVAIIDPTLSLLKVKRHLTLILVQNQ